MKTPLLVLLGVCALPFTTSAADARKPDSEGFIRDWLVLAPLPIGEGTGTEEIERKQFAEEAKPAAKDGAAQKIGSTELTWRVTTSPQFYVDFKALNPSQSEHVVGWAVCYVVSPAARTGLTLRMNSNDQGKVYLNGKEVVKFTETRTLEKDAEDSARDVSLQKGVNVVVLKVINEENNWQGSVRFVDAAGKPVTDLVIQTTP